MSSSGFESSVFDMKEKDVNLHIQIIQKFVANGGIYKNVSIDLIDRNK